VGGKVFIVAMLLAATPSPAIAQAGGDSRSAICQSIVESEARERREAAEAERHPQPDTQTYEETFPAPDGMQYLRLEAASDELARRILGAPCRGAANGWALPANRLGADSVGIFQEVHSAGLLRLPDGRAFFFAAVNTGDYHAALGAYAVANVNAVNGHKFFMMSGGGTFGFEGTLVTPAHQPLGGFQVWNEGGGTWQGYSTMWAEITDFSGPTPRDLGSLRLSSSKPCQSTTFVDGSSACQGGDDHDLISVAYSENGPDELTLTWRETRYGQNRSGRRIHVRTREYSALYELHGRYIKVRGEEPPEI
jgi:hypothetical protein